MRLKKRITVGLVPMGENIPDIALKVIAAHISGYMNLPADILLSLESPAYAYNEKRNQYNAGTILKAFETMCFDEYDKVIVLLDLDIFIPIFTHVFGEAKQGGKYALVSLFRLSGNDFPPLFLIYERAAKVALHELGHLFNLLHCEDSRCLMRFSGRLEELDEIPFYFCRYCSKYFKEAIQSFY